MPEKIRIGISSPDKAVKLKFAISLLQAASLEEDNDLQDMWAKLLINSSNESCQVELNRTYIDILERISSYDAQILNAIYSYPYEQLLEKQILTIGLPEKLLFREKDDKTEYKLENENVLLSILNLERLGCIEIPRMFFSPNKKLPAYIDPTILGRNFHKACTLPNKE